MPEMVELGCTYRPSSLVVKFCIGHPTISPCLNALNNAPDYRQDVLDLVVEQLFEPSCGDSYTTEVAESRAVSDLRTLLELMSPTIRSFNLLRSSCDPLHPSLDSGRIFKGVTFRFMVYLALHASATTGDHFPLPFSASFAPQLQHLQLPSNMLYDKLGYDVPTFFPRLTRLTIHPLRPSYTIAQFDALVKIGQFLGVSVSPDSRVAGACISTPEAQNIIDVTVYMHPTSRQREAELARFRRAVEERLAEGTKGDFRIHVEGLEPGLKEVTQALEEQLARGHQ